MEVAFEQEKGKGGQIDIGGRVKQIRKRQGMSQKEMATLVGVAPSTISQIESGTTYPSIPAVFKIAQVLNVPAAAFFREQDPKADRVVLSGGASVNFPDLPRQNISGHRLSPPDFEADAEPYLIEIPEGKKLSSHFFVHKGEELGYVLNGSLELKVGNRLHQATVGDVIYLTSDHPLSWQNTGAETARLLWIKIVK
jgi:transcriptional regulator with XRE-family HTH domain